MSDPERFTVTERTEWSVRLPASVYAGSTDPEDWLSSEETARQKATEDAATVVVSRRVFVMTGEWQPAPELTP